jgi:hypothetical protein
MLIDLTSDKFQFKLGAAATTNELPFTAWYNDYSSSAVTPTRNDGTSSGTSLVALNSASPAASHQFKIKTCSIFNADTVATTVKIYVYDTTSATSYQCFQAVLQVNETLQYEESEGWFVIDQSGAQKRQAVNIIAPAIRHTGYHDSNAGTASSYNTNNMYSVYLGKAAKAYTSISVVYRVTTASATITYCEAAIYKGAIMLSGAHNCAQRCGYTDCSAVWNSTGQKNTAISVSGINAGDDLFFVIANSSTTVPQFRSWVNDDISTNIFAASPKQQPSLTPSVVIGASGTTAIPLWVSWQGT